MNVFLTFIRTEGKRSNVRTSARIQLFCKKHHINVGCYDGFRVFTRAVKEKKALYMYKNHFRLIWKANGISFKKNNRRIKIKLQSC